MEGILEKISGFACTMLALQMVMTLLPGGNMRKFCKFVISMVAVVIFLGSVLAKGEFRLDLAFQQQSEPAGADMSEYEGIIFDVYNSQLENNNS